MTRDMKPGRLVLRGLTHYWRTNVAIVIGVATAAAVLTGALLVGDSVRGSLRDLVVQRLGRTDEVVISTGFFREQLADDLRGHSEFRSGFENICPIVVTPGFVSEQAGGRRAGQVRVYGVDDRFWKFHGVSGVDGPAGRDAFISEALAKELGTEPGATILVRVQRPSDIPIESLHGNKEAGGRTVRVTVKAVLDRESLGEFSLQAQQGDVRAVFLPLTRLQEDLEIGGLVNALLVSSKPDTPATALADLVKRTARLEDLGLKVRVLEERNAIALEADGGLIDDAKGTAIIEVLNAMSLRPQPVFTYLANSLRSGDREIPYSLVTAMDLTEIAPSPDASGPPPMLLNEWAARDLHVRNGDRVTMDYYFWEEPGRLATRTMEFRVAGIVPIDKRDRDLAPVYPGMTDSPTLGDWNPPFPIDLRRIRPVDEEYWKTYRTTPKAFIHFSVGYSLWRSRFASATSFRITPEAGQALDAVQQKFVEGLQSKINPLEMGLAVQNVRAEGLETSRGATDFGEYFVYFSFFLVASSLLLAALFFKLSVEQRAAEIGLLRAVGFGPAAVRRLFMREALALSVAGAVLGVLGGLGYAFAMVRGLRTWWVDAVGTTAITFHASPSSLAGGALGGIVAAMACIWVTLRSLEKVSERRLLSGQLATEEGEDRGRGRRSQPVVIAVIGFAGLGVSLMVMAAAGVIPKTAAFFGAGSALLVSCLCLFRFRFGRPVRNSIEGNGWWTVSRLGLRSATYRPARSVVSIAMIAAATFILISVDAFRREGVAGNDLHSGTGGYSLIVDSLVPIAHDPAGSEGRRMLGLADSDPVAIDAFRVRPGDDASCLNLYQPKNPRILAPDLSFMGKGRFAFQGSLASNAAEHADPWLLLLRTETDGAVPVIADANSMTYVLHRKLGEDITITAGDRTIKLRLVAALSDSIFQGELLMSASNFVKLFPEQQGYQFLLIETPPERASVVAKTIEDKLADFGADATPTAERLASFHRVENTYLSTFQMLGGLGLLLGTVGLGAVLLRNVLERRRELALLRALGYTHSQFFAIVAAENVLLLVSGLFTGIVCALLAIAPVLLDRGGRLPFVSLLLLLSGILAAGLITSIVATAAALRSSLLPALRSE